ncbi:MAG TPA: hypothetical protein VMJ70_01760 [Candidatus Sulfotelmatobacter sp.]|nr:hypothetical protein [Candidatus Sulfotelmatobacter sp.]
MEDPEVAVDSRVAAPEEDIELDEEDAPPFLPQLDKGARRHSMDTIRTTRID